MKKLAVLGLVLMMFMSVGYAAPPEVNTKWDGSGSVYTEVKDGDVRSIISTEGEYVYGAYKAKFRDAAGSEKYDYEFTVNADVNSFYNYSTINFVTQKKSGDDPNQTVRNHLKVGGGYGSMSMGTGVYYSEPHSTWNNVLEIRNMTDTTQVTNPNNTSQVEDITQEVMPTLRAEAPFNGGPALAYPYNLYANAYEFKMGKEVYESGDDVRASVTATANNNFMTEAGIKFGSSNYTEDHEHSDPLWYGPDATPVAKITGLNQPWYGVENSFIADGKGKLTVTGKGSFVKIGDAMLMNNDGSTGTLTQTTSFDTTTSQDGKVVKRGFDVEAGNVNNPVSTP